MQAVPREVPGHGHRRDLPAVTTLEESHIEAMSNQFVTSTWRSKGTWTS